MPIIIKILQGRILHVVDEHREELASAIPRSHFSNSSPNVAK